MSTSLLLNHFFLNLLSVTFIIGDGYDINCWDDVWVPQIGKLSLMASGNMSMVEETLRVADLVNDQGGLEPDAGY